VLLRVQATVLLVDDFARHLVEDGPLLPSTSLKPAFAAAASLQVLGKRILVACKVTSTSAICRAHSGRKSVPFENASATLRYLPKYSPDLNFTQECLEFAVTQLSKI
jgi:hypothetical protein